MGLLTVGTALSWEDTAALSAYIKEHGITQFLHTWRRLRETHDNELKFGDEIECGIFEIDPINKSIHISLRSAELREILNQQELRFQSEGVIWHPEFGAWMIESTPSRPYSNYASDLLRVERNMVLRRRRLLSVLGENEIAPTVTNFPLMGLNLTGIPHDTASLSPDSLSNYLPDSVINPHPRFAALTRNIRSRRGEKVNILVPLFQDSRTPEFLQTPTPTSSSSTSSGLSPFPIGFSPESIVSVSPLSSPSSPSPAPVPCIHMDCMAFGMGMCCLQVTFQARDIDESRYMYDQLAVLAPIMLALTAASPVFKGRLADIDARWTVISQSVDDRTPRERGLEGPEGIIPKSRYDSISTYIYHCSGDSRCHRTFEKYNDISCPIDEGVKTRLMGEGLDANLAHHLAHLFIRDPLVVFEGKVELDDSTSTDHFENIQSTNWQTCRWKPPPPRHSPEDPHIGWRTEFRSMEVQLTDFENAAFTVFVVLITRVLLSFDLALYLPLSKVDENMRRAQERDGAMKNKFFFRKYVAPHILHPESPVSFPSEPCLTTPLSPPLSPSETTDLPPLPSLTRSRSIGGTTSFSSTADLLSLVEGEKERESISSSKKPGCGCEATTTPSTSSTFSSSSLNTEINHTSESPSDAESETPLPPQCDPAGFEEMTMDEIFHGKDSYFPGLLPLVYAYLDFINCDPETHGRVHQYLTFISRRAKGELLTPATWMRNFLTSHPAYQQDSIVRPEMALDLMVACKDIGEGKRPCPELLGDITIERIRGEDAYGRELAGRLNQEQRSQLLQRLVSRSQTPAQARFSPQPSPQVSQKLPSTSTDL